MASRICARSLITAPKFHNSGSAPVIAGTPSSNDQFHGSLPHQPYFHMPWRANKPYLETDRTVSRNQRTSKPNRPPLPSSVQRAASAEDQQHPNSWASSHPQSVQTAHEQEDPNSSQISLCSSFGNTIDSGAQSYQEYRGGELVMHYGQPHAYALYDFETKVEGDLQFRAGDLLMLEDVVDEAWYRGHSVRTGQVGIFPMNHVEVKIPLSSGLYLESQPKPKIRTSLDPNEGRKTPITQSNVSASKAEIEESEKKPHTDQPDLPRVTSSVAHATFGSGLRRSQTQYGSFPLTFTPCALSAPNETENQLRCEKNDPIHIPTSPTASVITSIRPRSQTSVSQMAQQLEQQGVTVSRIKAIPPGARSIYPSSISPKSSGPPSVLMEQPSSLPDYAAADYASRRSRPPSAHMVPTPLAMIAREQNRILCKGKLAPTEAYPTSTCSDPALAESAATNDRYSATLFKNSERVVISTKSEIDLSRRQIQTESVSSDPSAALVHSSGPVGGPVSSTDVFERKVASPENHRLSDYSRYMAQLKGTSSNSFNKPAVFQKPTNYQSNKQTPLILKSREDTLVKEDERNDGEHNLSSRELQTKENGIKPSAFSRNENTNEDITLQPPTGTSNVLATTKALLELKPGQATCITKMTEVLSPEYSTPTVSASRTPLNHAVPELPDASTCLKAPSSTPNLDKKQTDNFKDAIFSSLKSKHKRPDQWLYVSYDFFGTESGDLTVHAGSVLRCLDPLPPPEHLDDYTIPERWLRCATWYGQVGQVPSTFVRRILDPEELDTLLQYRPRAQALYDFTPESKDDLPLQCGDILYLYEAVDPNWFRGESASTGQQGIFPIPFVRVICPL